MDIIKNLIQQLENSNAYNREKAALELARVRNKSTAEDLLKRLCVEDNSDVKQMIIYALGEIGSEKAISTLSEYSKADDLEMRLVVVEALGKFSIPKAREILMNCLKIESDINVRGAIIRTLANSDESKLVNTLLLNLNNDENIVEYQKIYSGFNKFNIVENFDNIINLYQNSLQINVVNKRYPKVLIDASLILDILLERSSIFLDTATEIINLVLSKSLNGYIAERGLREIWHTYEKLKGQEYANNLVILFLASFSFCKTDSEMIKRAGGYHLSSFETAIQLECVRSSQLDAIITLRDRDFLGCDFPNVYSPFQFLDSYNFRLQHLPEEAIFSLEEQKKRFNQSLPLEISEVQENELSLFEGWKIEHFELLCPKKSLTSATVIICNTQSSNKECRHSESAFGIGSAATLFAALDKAITHIVEQPQHIFESIKISNLEEGIEDSVMAVVVVKSENYKVRKLYIHKNMIKACFYAYVEAIKAIYNPDRDYINYNDSSEIFPFTYTRNSVKDIIEQYKTGERDFSKTNLIEANLVNANLSGISLIISDLSFSNLQGINLNKASLTEAILTKAIVSGAKLNEAVLCRAKLNNAILRNSELVQADLTKANLVEAILINADLSNADLTGANLTNADLTKADLTGTNLTNADLTKADLTGANLTNANLSGADLTGVDLTTTTIDGANLSKTNLSKADLRGLDLNKTVFCEPILTDTAMPEIKIKIYGNKRIEHITQLLNQFDSDHYVIYAVHSSTFGVWWYSELGRKFRQVNKELRLKGIFIKRVFIIPKDNFSDEIKEIIEEQANCGIEVRCISEDLAENLHSFDLRKTNLLVCKNILVPENSFTTMMLVNEKQQEESGYISYESDDIEMNEQRFTMIWENAYSSTEIISYC